MPRVGLCPRGVRRVASESAVIGRFYLTHGVLIRFGCSAEQHARAKKQRKAACHFENGHTRTLNVPLPKNICFLLAST